MNSISCPECGKTVSIVTPVCLEFTCPAFTVPADPQESAVRARLLQSGKQAAIECYCEGHPSTSRLAATLFVEQMMATLPPEVVPADPLRIPRSAVWLATSLVGIGLLSLWLAFH
jgi:hypothetical protein